MVSALGHDRTFCDAEAMSALPPKADMCSATRYVRFVPEADIERLTKKDPRAVMPRPLRKFGIEKDVERSDLSVVNNDDIQSGVVWGLAFRA